MPDDLFFNRGGGLVGEGETVLSQHIEASQLNMERIVSAYRQNIALPDVHVADRLREYAPVIVAEDGQELTPERRAQMMREAGVHPMFDEVGESTEQLYLDGTQSVFDHVIESERLGETAEGQREGYRIVQPRELELVELDDQVVRASDGQTHVPEVRNDHAE